MEAHLQRFVETLDAAQLSALFEHGGGVMTDLTASARLTPVQIGMLVDFMETENPSWSPDVAYQLIANHLHFTGSTRAKTILDHWADYRPKFRKIMPVEYRRALEEMERMRMGVAAE